MSPDPPLNPEPVFVTFKDCMAQHVSLERRLARIEAVNAGALITAAVLILTIVLAVWRLKGF